MTPEKLVSMALDAMQHAYAPYSGYKVGAALLCKDGSVVCGANIENAAYGPSNCAERTAIFTAVFEGKRDFAAIAVVGGKDRILKFTWESRTARIRKSCSATSCPTAFARASI